MAATFVSCGGQSLFQISAGPLGAMSRNKRTCKVEVSGTEILQVSG